MPEPLCCISPEKFPMESAGISGSSGVLAVVGSVEVASVVVSIVVSPEIDGFVCVPHSVVVFASDVVESTVVAVQGSDIAEDKFSSTLSYVVTVETDRELWDVVEAMVVESLVELVVGIVWIVFFSNA